MHIKLFEEYKKHKYTVNIGDVFDYITSSKNDWDSYKEEKFIGSLLLNKENDFLSTAADFQNSNLNTIVNKVVGFQKKLYLV